MLALVALVGASCAHRGAQQAVDHPAPPPLAAGECPPARCFPPQPEPPLDCNPRTSYACVHIEPDFVRKLCPDGRSVDGETGRCLEAADGSCYREVLTCPR
ncbi:MAG TPA: hypothetical protein VF334_07105 [Polyangia bacterium]